MKINRFNIAGADLRGCKRRNCIGQFLTECRVSRGGYLVFGRIHMLDFGSGRPTHPCSKVSCSNPSMYQFFLLKTHFIQFFIVKPIHVPKIHAQNPSMYQNFTNFRKITHPCLYISLSKPIHVPKFKVFGENDPPMYVHVRFKIHPCTSSIRIHENM